MSLTHTRLRVAVRVMRYYNLVSLTGAITGIAPFRDRSNHQFTAGHDSERGLKPFGLTPFEGQCRICPVQSFASCQFTGSFDCIPKTTRWASGTKEAVADEEK